MFEALPQVALPANRTLEVVYKAPGELTPDPRNARTHSKKQVAQIIASIRAFGFTNPILTDPEGNLIAGQGSGMAATTPLRPPTTANAVFPPPSSALRL